ncbi:MAG: cytochrome b/b6 domain-containing protein [Sphingomonas sp.]
MAEPATSDSETAAPRGGDLVPRHRVSTRIWHWINAFTIFVMLMSGLMIFNAHPRLYWGQYGANSDHAWLQIGAIGERRTGAIRGGWCIGTGSRRESGTG